MDEQIVIAASERSEWAGTLIVMGAGFLWLMQANSKLEFWPGGFNMDDLAE